MPIAKSFKENFEKSFARDSEVSKKLQGFQDASRDSESWGLQPKKKQDLASSKFSLKILNGSFNKYSNKGQFKIQQMAFVLVALMIFFAIVSLFYFSVRIGAFKTDVEDLRDQQAKELVKKLASTSEFALSSGPNACIGCLDFDKALIMKERLSYQNFWDLDYLEIRRVYPSTKGDVECTKANYPDCTKITITGEGSEVGAPSDAFISLCYWKGEKGGYIKCELGRIYASAKSLNE